MGEKVGAQIAGAVANARLYAALEKAGRAHRESEEKYRAFFEEDLTAAFISTPAGRILACNPAFDVTPARYITAIITEKGVARGNYERELQTLVNR